MSAEPDPPLPPAVRIAAVLAGAQGALGIGLAVALVVLAFTGPDPVAVGLATAGWFAVSGGIVLAVAVTLWRGGHGARTPLIVVQLLLVGVAWYAAGPSGQPGYGVPALLFCAVVLGLLFTPASMRWATGNGRYGTEPD